jgi:hypothetical protein
VNDVNQVVNAIWHDWNSSVVIHLGDVANAVWNHWGVSPYFNINNLASAFSAVDDNLVDVVVALDSVVDDAGQVAIAVWYNWNNSVNWNATDLAYALYNNFSISLAEAWSIVSGL